MKKSLMALSTMLMLGGVASAQKVAFEEYTLNNGLHVILHNDASAPVIITSVMYHVGSKNENPERTGFAHFFEHLLFEGTENIKRGEWFKIVTANGGTNNTPTQFDLGNTIGGSASAFAPGTFGGNPVFSYQWDGVYAAPNFDGYLGFLSSGTDGEAPPPAAAGDTPLRAGVLDRIGRALADGARAALRTPEHSNTSPAP
jgi:hypothetical protein